MSLFQDTAGEPLYKLFKALKHQIEKGPVDAKMKKAKYTLNDTGLLGDDVEYSVLVSMNKSTRSVQSSFTHTLSWRDYVSHRFDSSSSQGEGGVSVVHQSGPPAPE